MSFSSTIRTNCLIFVHRTFFAFISGSKCQKTSIMGLESFLFIALWMADRLSVDRKEGQNEKKACCGASIRKSLRRGAA